MRVGALIIAVTCAVGTAQGALIGIDFSTGNLYDVSSSTASLQLIGHTNVTNSFADLQRAPNGTLYGVTIMPGGANPPPARLYSINPQTAQANLIAPLNGSFIEGGLAFSPAGTAYLVQAQAASNGLAIINLTTGNLTYIGDVSYGTAGNSVDLNSMVWRSDGKLIAVARNDNDLITINPTTGQTAFLADLAPAAGPVGGMTVTDGVGYLTTGNVFSTITGSNELWRFDPFTGAQTRVGSFAPTISGLGMSGLAFVPEPCFASALLSLCAISAHRRIRSPKLER